MTAEDREALAATLRVYHGQPNHPVEQYHREADALQSVVDRIARRRAADELRRAAEESTYWVMTRETVYTRLNEHADALEAE